LKHYTQDKSVYSDAKSITVVVTEKLKNSAYANRYVAELKNIDQEERTGSILLNITNPSNIASLQIGSELRFKTKLVANKPVLNPHQFDYGSYLRNKQIYAQIYVEPTEIEISSTYSKDIWYYTAQFRERMISNIKTNGFSNRELQIAIALLLGQQQEIDPDLVKDYQFAGAVHILSVSGLHVGFILIFMTYLLRIVPNTKKGSLLKLFITLLSLWLFGALAGFAPSVVRSVTMFSFIAIGKHLRRGTDIYHTLLVSILLILLIRPSFLFDVGFQLSYTAVFFIIWLQPLIASLWKPKTKIATYFWDILTLSFAAQIGTLPLSIYYFHQFPGLFFVTNLIIIPLLTFIMAIGVFIMGWAAFHEVPRAITQLLEWTITAINKIISSIASVEQFILTDIPLHFYLLIGGYFMIIATILCLKKPSYSKLMLVLITILGTQLAYLILRNQFANQNEMIVYQSTKNSLITIRNGTTINVFTNPLFDKNSKNNLLTNYKTATYSQIKNIKSIPNLISYKGHKIMILDSTSVWIKNSRPEILLLTQSARVNLDRLLKELKPKIVLADGSNYKTLLEPWKQSCEQQKIPFHATAEKGYYCIK
ncbi:MAG: ComEC/Rec2 family competence protein, partial [Flavobacterium sp.]